MSGIAGSARAAARRDAVNLVVIVVGVALRRCFALPSLLSPYWIVNATIAFIYAIVALGLGLLVGRVGMISLGQGAVLALGGWVGARLLFATSLPYPIVLIVAGPDHDGDGDDDRAPGAARQRPVSRARHADARRRDQRRPDRHQLPQRRQGLPRLQRHLDRHAAVDPAAVDRDVGPRVLPLHRDRRADHVPARAAGTSAASPAAPGRRSARASRRRSPPAST